MLWLDAYERRARLAPGLLALLPLAVAGTALGVRQAPIVTTCIGLLSVAGGPVVLATYVRWAGLRAQDRLWAEWGAPPTTIGLRTQTVSANQLRRDLWRKAVAAATSIPLLDAEAERADQVAADNAIDAAVGRLRRLTQGKEHALLAAENRNYGFQRNLYGLRHVGRAAAIAACVLLGSMLMYAVRISRVASVPADISIGLFVTTSLLAFWIFGPSSRHVRRAGDKYAEQLFEAAASLEARLPVTSETKDASGEQ